MAGGLAESLEKLRPGQHLCSFYENADQLFSTAAPFIRYGLENGEKCIYVAHESSVSDIKSALRNNGVDVQRYINSGQLAVMKAEDIYLRLGRFDLNDVLELWNKTSGAALKGKYRGMRIATEMTWALGKSSTLAELAKYEAKINDFLAGSSIVGLCEYDRTKFRERDLLDAMRTHPLVILDGQVCDNLYYVPANELSKENHRAKSQLDNCLNDIENNSELPEIFHRYRDLEEKDRKVVDKFLKVILEMDANTQEAFAELFGKKRYGAFSLIFKAGDCIGFDWKSSHRR